MKGSKMHINSPIIYIALLAATLTACTPSKSEKILYPEFVHLRVVLEHGTTEDQFRKLVEQTRLDFETNKASLSDKNKKVCDSALAGC